MAGGAPDYGAMAGAQSGFQQQDPALTAWLKAVSSGISPEAIAQYAGAIESGLTPEQASNPDAYGYNYAPETTGTLAPQPGATPAAPGAVSDLQALQGQKDLAFSDTNAYDYRSDPSYLALTRALNFQADDANRIGAQQIGNLDVLQPITEDDILANQDRALNGVDANYESRGVYRSGDRALARANTTGDYGRQLTAVQTTGALQRGNVQSDLAAQLAAIERRRADALTQFANPPLPGAPTGSF